MITAIMFWNVAKMLIPNMIYKENKICISKLESNRALVRESCIMEFYDRQY